MIKYNSELHHDIVFQQIKERMEKENPFEEKEDNLEVSINGEPCVLDYIDYILIRMEVHDQNKPTEPTCMTKRPQGTSSYPPPWKEVEKLCSIYEQEHQPTEEGILFTNGEKKVLLTSEPWWDDCVNEDPTPDCPKYSEEVIQQSYWRNSIKR